MSNRLRIVSPSKIVRFVLAAVLLTGICIPGLPTMPHAYAATTGTTGERITVTYGKGDDILGNWNEQILTVDGTWAYCVEVDGHFESGLNVRASDPVATEIWPQELCTRLALIDEFVWSGNFVSTSLAGETGHKVTDKAEQYAIAQAYLWKALDDAGYSDYGWFAVAMHGENLTGRDTDAQVQDYVRSRIDNYVGHASYYDCGNHQSVACNFHTEPATGSLELQKASAHDAFVADNASYSLEGAAYGVFETEDCTGDPISTLTTDKDGRASVSGMYRGDYFVKETSASPGFEIDDTVYPVTIIANETTTVNADAGTVPEEPRTGGLQLMKASALKNITAGNPLYSNEGAVYGVFSDEACTTELARMTTNKQGKAAVDGLPLGTKYVKELAAPTGMALDATTYQATVVANQTVDVGTGTMRDVPKSAAVNLLIAKHDAQKPLQDGANRPQGSASLENAQFTVWFFAGMFESAREARDSGTLQRTWVFKTDAQGQVLLDTEHLIEGDALYANSSGQPCLPLGTVVVSETKPPAGYLANAEEWCVQITDDGGDDETLETYVQPSVADAVKRGDLELVKVGGISMKRLGGVAFRITSQTTGESHVFVTDDNGCASTASSWNAHSHNTNGNDDIQWEPTVEKERTESEQQAAPPEDDDPPGEETARNAEDDTASNEAVTSDDSADNGAAPESEDGMRAEDDPEEHDAVEEETPPTESVGMRLQAALARSFDSDATTGEGTHSPRTSYAARIPAEQDIANRASDTSPYDSEAGIWFGLGDDGTVSIPVDDARGALPYDTYAIEELPSPGNAGLQLVQATVVVSRDNQVVDLGTVNDPQGSIGTTARDKADGDSTVACGEQASVIDRVAYANLIPGREYVMEGTLMDAATAKPLEDTQGEAIVASTTFTPESSHGSVEMTFSFSSLALQGNTLVAFERLTCEGRVVAAHDDPEDTDQSVIVATPTLGTSTSDPIDGDGAIAKDREATIVDRVSYSGLTPGVEYRLEGVLMDKATEAPLTIDGSQVVQTASLVPSTSSGTADMTFTFDASALEDGTQLVAFEKLSLNEAPIASHEDLQDAGQTIVVEQPAISTTLADAASGEKTVGPTSTMTLVDTVAFAGLVPNREYRMQGTLMDKSTGKPATDAKGDAVTATTTFTPEASQGTIDLPFTFDGVLLAGRELVAFETLMHEDDELAVHANLKDEAQTITVTKPNVSTHASNAKDSSKTIQAEDDAVIADLVHVSGVAPHAKYLVVGVLMDRATGMPVTVSRTKGPDSTQESSVSDTAEVTEIWSTMLKAANLEMPNDGTEGAIVLDNAVKLDFQAVGALLDAHPEAFESMVMQTQIIEPTSSDFDTTMELALPSIDIAGQAVVFEALIESDSGTLVALHADYDDSDQTLEIARSVTPSEKTHPQNGPGSSYDKTGNILARYGWVFALAAAFGCASAAYGIARQRTHERTEPSSEDMS